MQIAPAAGVPASGGPDAVHPRPPARHLITFDSDLSYQASLPIRLMFAAPGVFLFALLAFLWSGAKLPRPGIGFVVPTLLVSGVACWMILNARTRFILGKFRIVDQGAFVSNKLDYAEIAEIRCRRDVKYDRGGAFPGRRFEFAPKNAFSLGLSLFVPDVQPLPYEMRVRLQHLLEALGAGQLPP